MGSRVRCCVAGVFISRLPDQAKLATRNLKNDVKRSRRTDESLARFEYAEAFANVACEVIAEVELTCTDPIRQLFQSTIAANPRQIKNASTRGQGRVLRPRTSPRPRLGDSQ